MRPPVFVQPLAIQLVDAETIHVGHDLARQIEMRLKLPMTTVLDAVPGDSIAERSRQIGITRATYYSWHEGRSRPKLELAKRLEELTGISAEAIIAQPRSPQ